MRIAAISAKVSIRVGGSLLLAGFLLFPQPERVISAASDSSSKDLLEKALFTHSEFFGSEAIASLPTAETRENLTQLAEQFPNDPEILIALADSEEKLNDFDGAEKTMMRLVELYPENASVLGAFYDRRGRYPDEARILEKRLLTVADDQKTAVFRQLLGIARQHDLKDYLQPAFYQRVARENADVFGIFEELIAQLKEDEDYAASLSVLREAESQFPERRAQLLDREIELLTDLGKDDEAEKVYIKAFDPFWSNDEVEKFYGFLSDHEHLREYGAELKTKFQKNPADLDTAVRFALYRENRYEDPIPIIKRMEQAKKSWSTEELVTIARILIRANEGELASRYLYTLYARDDFRTDPDMRKKVLYQLFEMFCDAEEQKLAITKGDLKFYEKIGTADPDPGITTGILSLIFSDTDPKGELADHEITANKFFNRAAAYRIFVAFKNEYPDSNELGQMYLDTIRLYTTTKNTDIAEQVLNEFSEKYKNARDFPVVALKLADAFAATGDAEKSRAIYREILERLEPGQSPEGADSDRNRGINPPAKQTKSNTAYDDAPVKLFNDYLDRTDPGVTYGEVLDLLVSSLKKDKKTGDILELYSVEINKRPNTEWLYEQRLDWLEQTNLTEEQLAAYRTALDRFQSASWSDKLARWFIRQKRQDDFESLSDDLIGKLDDSEIQGYLSEFINSKVTASDFEKALYLRMYLKAHQRFPHNITFVQGLLNFYKENKRYDDWQKLAAQYFFVSKDVRKLFLDDLAQRGELANDFTRASGENQAYVLFKGDAAMRLSRFEQAVDPYRELVSAYPNQPEFSEPMISLTRSLGQKDPGILKEASDRAHDAAEFDPSSSTLRTRSGEIYAEIGDYSKSRSEWEKLVAIGAGDKETYLDTATLYWDYFQYGDALRVIGQLRKKFGDDRLHAFEAGAIHEALHDQKAAVSEYIKALDSTADESQAEKARRRLVTLASRKGLPSMIDAAFRIESARRKNPESLALGFANYLFEAKRPDHAQKILDRQIAVSRNSVFLESARELYSEQEITDGEKTVLKRLAETADNPRREIKYRLELVESLKDDKKRDAAKTEVQLLISRFPTNYGVVTETSDILHRLGYDTDSASVLQNALTKSQGKYRAAIAGRLARQLIKSERLDAAELVLTAMHSENAVDLDLFHDLAGIYVRKNQPALLRKAFDETAKALKNSDTDRRELDDEIAEFRAQMIDAFTRLKDYNSATEQHIEIINRDPDNETNVNNAIAYVKRYGGGSVLRDYYQQLSKQAFKNYRWNVVLARIAEADHDADGAIRNYNAAIVNQPEMEDLYLAIADIETARGNYDEALKNISTVLELTNDSPDFIKKKIVVLKKARRFAEADAEAAKLPVEQKPAKTDDPFAAAREKRSTDVEESRKLLQEAFDRLTADPLAGELSSADIVDYVRTVRGKETLDRLSLRLWTLRDQLLSLSDQADSKRAGEARQRLSILDNAMIASIGEIAKLTATDDELATLHTDLKNRITSASLTSDTHGTFGVLDNLARRAGFGDLDETIQLKGISESTDKTEKANRTDRLAAFYEQRGAYAKELILIWASDTVDASRKAEAARLTGDQDKELEALRLVYSRKADGFASTENADVTRYLHLLYDGNHEELQSLTGANSFYQFQLINFLLAKGEPELAHRAIESSSVPKAWKLARNAETSLALREFDRAAECYFCDALQFESIGEMIARTPDKQRFMVGDDWFRLNREYGEWLEQIHEANTRPSLYLAAMTENQPRNGAKQSDLGEYYLSHKDPAKAAEHFRLAVELDPTILEYTVGLGVAYERSNTPDLAAGMWNRALSDSRPENLLAFFEAMQGHEMSATARKLLPTKIVKFLETANIDDSQEMENLIQLIARSFDDQKQRAEYFQNILDLRTTDTSLAEFLINEDLIDPTLRSPFYERLISGNKPLAGYENDYQFISTGERTWNRDDTESIYDQENKYDVDEPDNDHVAWEEKYLEHLLFVHNDLEPGKLIPSIENELKGRYARPPRLRLASLQIQVRAGKFDLAVAQRFIGISAADAVTNIIPPSTDRLADVVKMLKHEGHDHDGALLSQSFYARMIALGQYDASNFAGLATADFDLGDADSALRILQLMADLYDPDKSGSAASEIAGLDLIKHYAADGAKTSEEHQPDFGTRSVVLDLASLICTNFKQPDAAVAYRRRLRGIDPNNSDNNLSLAKILASQNQRDEESAILNEIINDPFVPRSSRWQAKWQLAETGDSRYIANNDFDAYSQFYCGLKAGKHGDPASAIDFLTAASISGQDILSTNNQELIRNYALANRPFAALKLAANDKDESDEMLTILSKAAQQTGDYRSAIAFEKRRTDGRDLYRLAALQKLAVEAEHKATDLIVDKDNTRKL